MKRPHGGAIEAPICARVDDKRSLAAVPNKAGTRALFGFQHDKFRCVVDDETRKKMSTDSATHAKKLELPTNASAYNKRPWRCFRDVVAAGHFKAEALRAQAENRASDIDRAMCGLVVCPFEWDTTENFDSQTAFVVFTMDDNTKIKFHFKSATLKRLCILAGKKQKNTKKKKNKKKKASRGQ